MIRFSVPLILCTKQKNREKERKREREKEGKRERETDGNLLGRDADAVVPGLTSKREFTRKVIRHLKGREKRDRSEKLLIKADDIVKTFETGLE